jgi:DNA repair protein RadA/Sms
MILAVLQRHTRTVLRKVDVHVNVVGGLKVTDPAADLPIALAIMSSATDSPLPLGTAAVGELGLSGEVRPVTAMALRANALARVGMTTLVGPRSVNSTHKGELATSLEAVKHISHAAAWLAKNGGRGGGFEDR